MLLLPPWESPMYALAMFLFGATIGSFLNVVIYRLPLELSVNKPKRSFCPICKGAIPFWRNIPLFTWLAQRGKCAECAAGIPVRYFIIECFTALLWVGSWWMTRDSHPLLGVYFAGLVTLWLAVAMIDLDHMIIPRELSWFGAGWAIVGAIAMFYIVPLEEQNLFGHALAAAGETSLIWVVLRVLIAGAVGWLGLWMCVLIGKLMFGRQSFVFDENVDWQLVEPETDQDELSLRLGDDDNFWSDLFFRPKSDKVVISGLSELLVDGRSVAAKEAQIWHDRVVVEGETYQIEELKSISGKLKKVVIPREAMGMGDVDLLGVFGMSLGMLGLLPIILIGCLSNIVTALVARIGFGKHTPFGPSLVIGAVVWIIWGPQIWSWYSGVMQMFVL